MVNYQNKFTFLSSRGRRTRFPNRAGHNVKVILKSTIKKEIYLNEYF